MGHSWQGNVTGSRQGFGHYSDSNIILVNILRTIELELLEPAFVERVLDSALTSRPTDDQAPLVAERAKVAREIENLTAAIAAGGDIPALAAALKDRDRKLRSLDAQLTTREEEPDRERLRAALFQRIADWKAVLRENVPQARVVLQRLVGPMHLRVQQGDFSDILRACGVPTDLPGADTLIDFVPAWATIARPEGLLSGLDLEVVDLTGVEPVTS